MEQRLRPYDRRVPTKFEMAFSLTVVAIVAVLGVLILTGAFGINPAYKATLGLVLIGYSLVRFWMLRSRYRRRRREEECASEPPKEQHKTFRKV